eukprot:GHUV01051707.1.p1 GENE.GHUV01051707.1~~GHUV01051707.1.p1  ORF type:complete len:151 (+),score=14.98 GHUV01051707.1:209-661(+)
MEWDTVGRSADIELSSNCLTATKTSSATPSTVRGTILYNDLGVHEFHVILDSLGPDGIWAGVARPDMDPNKCVGDVGCGWALHSDGDRRFNGREEEFTGALCVTCYQGMMVSSCLCRTAMLLNVKGCQLQLRLHGDTCTRSSPAASPCRF